MSNILIIITLQHEATHCWPECPLDDVAFLKHPHRHVFFIEATKRVSHTDRDVEIIIFKRNIQSYLKAKYGQDFGRMSCEDIASDILVTFGCHSVSVKEDNENGAIVYSEGNL